MNAQQSSPISAIARDLLALGVQPGGVLLAHSSLSSLGYVDGGAESVIRGLLEALGPDGTLLMPALTYEYVTSWHPVFDIRYTRSNVGVIPETFRTRLGSLRSMHPTHSVCAAGRLAAELLGNHAKDDTPCGPHSPFRILPEVKGQILMLGCGLHPNTSMHAIEELVIPPYLFAPPMMYTLIDDNGTSVEKQYIPHDFRGWDQRYDRVAQYLSPPSLVSGAVLRATAYLLDAASFWDVILSVYQENPLAFVERRAE